ncbi:hypothetical protein AH2_00014 [Burkholderia phage vB_BceS_AH2]|uniref:DUF7609 domain-containing protein n=1 Tax=Burkholderia phage vB_BceS_AH2 TaxID=1133022 RepID=I6NLH7_9CAUD|nr:hypothetical protein B613_gp14 [Burkholderia phage vB_BceS_AH2]AEY69525.1 hypothetical protein AH2_00014 [Burkholderia phage vB_BceS_AH2]
MATATAEDVRQASLAQQIADLDISKTVSLAERLEGNAATKEVIKETTERMRNLISPAVARAKKRTSGDYTVETGTLFTRSLDILVVAAITRTA